MVVATLHRLKEGVRYREGVWSDPGRYEEISTKIVSRQFVHDRNGHNNNENYTIDEKATAELMVKREANIIENAEKDKRSKMTTSDLVDAIVGKKESKPVKKSEKPITREDTVSIELPEGDPSEEWTLGQLQHYCKINDIKFHHASKAPKLLELINK
jgi:hypothetical protein